MNNSPEVPKAEVKSEEDVKNEATEVKTENAGFTALEIDPLDTDLTTDDIEDDILKNPDILSEVTVPGILAAFSTFSDFQNALKKRYKNFEFDPDDFLILWNLDCIKKKYLLGEYRYICR